MRSKHATFRRVVSEGLSEDHLSCDLKWCQEPAWPRQPGRGNSELKGPQQGSVRLVEGTERRPVWLEVNEEKRKWLKDKISRSQIMRTSVQNDKEFVFNLRSVKSHKGFTQGGLTWADFYLKRSPGLLCRKWIAHFISSNTERTPVLSQQYWQYLFWWKTT